MVEDGTMCAMRKTQCHSTKQTIQRIPESFSSFSQMCCVHGKVQYLRPFAFHNRDSCWNVQLTFMKPFLGWIQTCHWIVESNSNRAYVLIFELIQTELVVWNTIINQTNYTQFQKFCLIYWNWSNHAVKLLQSQKDSCSDIKYLKCSIGRSGDEEPIMLFNFANYSKWNPL